MTDALRQPHIKPNPGESQSRAADPMKSVWVGASAGTGKTKVLIERVLRLMLPRPGLPAESATAPEKILCLTFTKTAAAEMSARIFQRLADWAVMPEEALVKDLLALNSRAPDREMTESARRLFARVLSVPGGLKIMTIHSFCQSVLKRFPVEANLAPHFQLMDEQSAIEYLTRCLHDLIADAKGAPDSSLAKSFDLLVMYLDQQGMSELMSKIMGQRSHLARIFRQHGEEAGAADKTVRAIATHLGVQPDDTPARVLARGIELPEALLGDLRAACQALAKGKKTDAKYAAGMAPFLESPARRAALFNDYCSVFFDSKGEIRGKFATADVVDAMPAIQDIMGREAQRLAAVREQLKAVELFTLNRALFTIAADLVGRYEAYKRDTDQLDYEDLILRTVDLLDEQMVPWVLFKLDEGIDHILVDEAQDTSPQQWRVVRALADDFFAGRNRAEQLPRTLFVVGDEKQSIFSFQGADPAEFDRMQKFFGGKVTSLQEGWEVLLEYSFRSTPAVLDIVDQTFAPDMVRRGVVADLQRRVHHLPFRAGQAGLIEIWPLITRGKKEAGESWVLPTDVTGAESPNVLLARKIASTIAGWLQSSEMLPSKNRKVRAGDVMILVQSRTHVDTLMRALKDEEVPVAGVDRITLSEEIAVMDLLALGQFALLPRDDLALGTILKSPLLGLSEEELFDLCYNRRGSLWEAVREGRADLAAWLSPLIALAARATPYEFFAGILAMPAPTGAPSGRAAFYARLGLDIDDAVDEFLNSCLKYEQSHTPSLQKFIHWFQRGAAEIKREQEAKTHDQVRIMTVHASKGLQAPIVFLPDAARKGHDHNKGRARLLWPSENDENGVPLWSPRKEFDADVYAARQAEAAERQEEEYRRLLYVALTRAEDRLYIAGAHGMKKPPPGTWHEIVSQSFPEGATTHDFMTNDEGEMLQLRRWQSAQDAPAEKEKTDAATLQPARIPLPGWVFSAPPEEPALPSPLTPSKPGEDEPAAKGPLSPDDSGRFRRGIIVHDILEALPQLPPNARRAALKKYLAKPGLDLGNAAQDALGNEIMAVLEHPDFAPIFGPGSRAEVPVVGLTGTLKGKAPVILSGQMDRLLVTGNEVLVIDYKTNRPPPTRAEDVPVIYLKQMAAYVSVLKSIYPDKTIKSALLWTDGPRLMPMPDNLLEPYLP